MAETGERRLAAAGLAASGLVVFGLLVNAPYAWARWAAFAGLALILFCFLRSLREEPSPAALLGLARPLPRPAVTLLLSVMFGVGLAVLSRWRFDMTLLPRSLGWFAPIAALIGAMEELLVRGYVQGRLSHLGRSRAVVLAALVHTAYKCSLFLLAADGGTDFAFLAFWTFTGGLAFGAMREATRSVLPPLAAHAAFDIALYGGLGSAPHWVW